MGRSQKWPDLRSPISRIRDIRFVGTDNLIIFRKFYNFPKNIVAVVRLESYFVVGSLDLTWWPDLAWPWVEIFTKAAENMRGQVDENPAALLRPIFNEECYYNNINMLYLNGLECITSNAYVLAVGAIWARVVWAKVIWANYFHRRSLQRYDFWAIVEYSDFQCERKPCFSGTNFSDHYMSDCASERHIVLLYSIFGMKREAYKLPKSRIISRWGTEQWNLHIT